MKPDTKTTHKIFLLGILLSAVSFSTQLLDFTLVPRFIALALCLCFCVFLMFRSKINLPVNLTIIPILYLSFTVFTVASLIWANTKSESYFESSKLILSFCTFILTIYFLKKDAEYFYDSMGKITITVTFILIAFGLFQLYQLNTKDKEAIYTVTGINGHKNLFASFIFLNLFFLIRTTLVSKGRKKILPLFCVFFSLLFIFFLKTKAVWFASGLALVVGSFLFIYRLESKQASYKNRTALFVLIFAVLINIFFFGFFQTFLGKSIHYTSQLDAGKNAQANTIKLEEERLILWDKTLDMIKEHPLVGVGAGNWQVHFPNATLSGLWRAEDLNYTFQRPHNDLLWILSETGFIGFNLFLFFLFFLLFSLLRICRLLKDNFLLSMEVILCFCFILGFLVISFFDFPKERMEHNVWINIIFGIAFFHISKHSESKSTIQLNIKSNTLFLTFLVLAFIFFIGVLRFKGEFYTRKMLDFKNNNQKTELVKAVQSASSFVYSIDPTSVPLHWYSGNAKAALGLYAQAKSDFLLAYKLCPYNRNVLNDLASAYAMSGNNELAKEYYEEAARISPRFDDPKLNLAAICIQENNFKEADFWLKSIYHDSERRKSYQEIVSQNNH